jgi:hypothetical protein
LTITSPTSGGRSVGIVSTRTQTTEFVVVLLFDANKLERIQRKFAPLSVSIASFFKSITAVVLLWSALEMTQFAYEEI